MRVCGQVKTGVLTTALPILQNKRSNRTNVLVNRLIELVFGVYLFSGLWRFCELPNWHLTELVFHNEHKIELVFEFDSAAARRPIRDFSVKPGHTPHTQNFPET